MNQSTTITDRAPDHPPSLAQDWSRGWRYVTVRRADGTQEIEHVPLTEEEMLHPEEGFVMPERTEHARLCSDLAEMLRAHALNHPSLSVFRDLRFEWDHPEVKPYAPDIAVVAHVREPAADRGTFVVATEGVRPILLIEIVSPVSRQADRRQKVLDYALAGVQEYIYIDPRTIRGKQVWEMAGFRLERGSYLPIVPDEDGAIYCVTIQARIGIEDGRVWMEDATTGQELLNNIQSQQARIVAEARAEDAEARAEEEAAARHAAEVRAEQEAAARRAVEARLAELEAQLLTRNPPTNASVN